MARLKFRDRKALAAAFGVKPKTRGKRARKPAAKGPPRPLEISVQAAVWDALLACGCWAYRQNNGGMVAQNSRGEGRFVRFVILPDKDETPSDLIGQTPDGRFLAVEVKRPGEDPTPAQQKFLDGVNRRGGVGFVARSVDDVLREAASRGWGR